MHLSYFYSLCAVSYYGEGKKLNGGGGEFENTLKITKKNIQCLISTINFSLYFLFHNCF